MAQLQSAVEFDAAQRKATVDAIEEIAKQWASTPPRDFDAWFGRNVDRLVRTVEGGQIAAVRGADRYVGDALDEQGIKAPKVAEPNPARLVGVTADGRTIDGLLAQSIIGARARIAEGMPAYQAWQAAGLEVRRVIENEFADAGRAATGIGITSRLGVGYVRMLVPPSCSRCVILAGRYYHWSNGFRRHPNCLPAGVAVSGPATLATTRRWYEGELVVATTASGQELPVTGNHPVLTDRGWVPANLLQEGDHVVRSTRGQGATALAVPYEDQVPSLIEDLWRPDRMMTLRQMPTAPEDFHGDGRNGEVDIVFADRLLWDGLQTSVRQRAKHEEFTRRIAEPALLTQFGAAQQPFDRVAGAAHRVVRSGSLGEALIGSLPPSLHLGGCGHVADFDPAVDQVAADHRAGDAIATAERVLAFASAVRRRDIAGGELDLAPRWDAPAGPLTVQSRVAYAARGQDLLLRLTGQIELDRVVEIRRIEWSGHVYNLTSSEGWFSANGLIVSNCNCKHIPSREDRAGDKTTDPKAYFESLTEAEQRRVFTVAGAEAIRDGADIGQVVNARRGLTIAGGIVRDGVRLGARAQRTEVFGLTTTEGTTRRGHAGRRMRGAKATPRLMPEAIYEIAANRAEAIDLLRKYGYVL